MSDTETRLALLERDMGGVSTLLEKLDKTIDSIEHLTNNLSNVIQLHERRLIESEKLGGELSHLVEERRKETTENLNMIHNRLNTHIKEDIERHEKFENNLNDTVKSMKDCLTTSNKEFQEELRKELKGIYKIRNLVVGGLFVLYIILTQVPAWYNWITASGSP